MALTRPRAYQIYDIDYKQATRVITVSNITLSGGAPSQVDGVNLSINDRVLVTGQSNAAQNGIYEVDTVGSGSNGTWTRSSDTNTTGELLAGTIVMVTEGLIYADTQWKLVTDDPIVIGTSELIFEQNSAFAFGNVYANGTAVLASSVGDVLTLTPGDNISITGNNTSKTVTIGVTGISLNSISNGTSNVNVVSSGGNVTVGVAGTGNVAVFSNGGLEVSGNITGNGAGLSGINTFSTVAVTGGNSAVADSISDTLTITAGSGIALVMNSATDTLTIAASSGSDIFVDGADFGTVTEEVTASDDLGLVTEAVESESDLGSIVTSGVIYPDLLVVEQIEDLQILGGTNGQYLGTSGNGVMQWQTLDSAPLEGSMVGNIDGNSYSITNLATLSTGVVTGNLIPSANITYDLGNTTNRWRDLWISNSTIYLGEVTITSHNSSLLISGQTVVTQTETGNTATTHLIANTVSVSGNATISTSLAVGNTTPSSTIGEIRATNAITAFYSDRRLKTNIKKIDQALHKVKQLSGVVYTQNELAQTFGYNDYSQQVGVFAQDVQQVQPEAVKPAPFDIDENGQSKSGENYLTVQYEKLVPLLVEAIKELSDELDKIKQQLPPDANNS
jgi:hypothetical protein